MEQIIFYILAAIIIVFAVAAVNSNKILHAVIYLLFVLASISGIYFLINYNFLAALQLTIYAGGVIVLIIFSVMLTHNIDSKLDTASVKSKIIAGTLSIVGVVTTLYAVYTFPQTKSNIIMISGISIYQILTLTTIVFFIGVYGFITRKNLIAVLISIELILNASAINFVIFNTYLYPNKLQGVYFSIFIIAIAAAESALAVSIIVSIYRMLASVDVKDTETLKY